MHFVKHKRHLRGKQKGSGLIKDDDDVMAMVKEFRELIIIQI